ncbi:MAG: hypothetical protein ACM3UY_04210 [Methanocella sp.]|jgi:hypothetical protein
MLVIIFILASVAAFTSLSLLRRFLTGNKLSSGDTYFHLYIAEHIQKNSWRFPKTLPKVILDEGGNIRYNYLIYPPLLHYITALIPHKYHLKSARILNLVILALISGLAATLVFSLSSNLPATFFTVVIVVFNLAVFELAVTFTPRPLGLLFYSLVVVLAVFFPQNSVALVIISLLVSLIALSHKFALQILVLALVPYSLIFGNPLLLLSLFLGVLLAVAMSRGFYLKILKEHLGWLYFYSRHPPQAKISMKLKQIFARNFWFLVAVGAIVLFLAQSNPAFDSLMVRTTYWAIITMVVAIVISIPRLAFLGEDYRYIEYSILPVGVIGGLSVVHLNLPVLILILIALATNVLALFKYKKYLATSYSLTNPEDLYAYKKLAEFGSNNMLVIPHIRTLEVGYFTKLKVVHGVRTVSNSIHDQLEHLTTNYTIDYVVKYKKLDPYLTFFTLQKMFNPVKVFDFENYEVYQIPHAA